MRSGLSRVDAAVPVPAVVEEGDDVVGETVKVLWLGTIDEGETDEVFLLCVPGEDTREPAAAQPLGDIVDRGLTPGVSQAVGRVHQVAVPPAAHAASAWAGATGPAAAARARTADKAQRTTTAPPITVGHVSSSPRSRAAQAMLMTG